MGMTRVFDALCGREAESCEIVASVWQHLTVTLHGQRHELYPGLLFWQDMVRWMHERGSPQALVGLHVAIKEHESHGPGLYRLTIIEKEPA